MFKRISLCIIAGVTLISAKDVVSILPIYTREKTVQDDRIVGAWPALFDDMFIISKTAHDYYRFELHNKDGVFVYKLYLIRTGAEDGNRYFVDLYPLTQGEQPLFESRHCIFLHSIHMITFGDGKMYAKPLNAHYFINRTDNQQAVPRTIRLSEQLLLTESTDNLREFLFSHADDDSLFLDGFEFTKKQ